MSGPKYTHGQRVEVLGYDFNVPGIPEVWMSGTVTAVDPTYGGRWVVTVARAGRTPVRRMVGKRGGNSRIRAVATEAKPARRTHPMTRCITCGQEEPEDSEHARLSRARHAVLDAGRAGSYASRTARLGALDVMAMMDDAIKAIHETPGPVVEDVL